MVAREGSFEIWGGRNLVRSGSNEAGGVEGCGYKS
jgi:hypothetical protein